MNIQSYGEVYRIPDNQDRIHHHEIESDEIKKIIVPSNVTYISEEGIINCTNLESIEFENHDKPFGGERPCKNCSKLKRIVFADWETFYNYGCDYNGDAFVKDVVIYIGKEKMNHVIVDYPCASNFPSHFGPNLYTLVGATDIEDLVYRDGSRVIGYQCQNHFGATNEYFIGEIIAKYPGVEHLLDYSYSSRDVLKNIGNVFGHKVNVFFYEFENDIFHSLVSLIEERMDIICEKLSYKSKVGNEQVAIKEIKHIVSEWLKIISGFWGSYSIKNEVDIVSEICKLIGKEYNIYLFRRFIIERLSSNPMWDIEFEELPVIEELRNNYNDPESPEAQLAKIRQQQKIRYNIEYRRIMSIPQNRKIKREDYNDYQFEMMCMIHNWIPEKVFASIWGGKNPYGDC